jgi:calcineurin-like phosphoesterase family protein
MTVFFTADTHFGHANIIRYCNRPFASVQEMDEVLIQRWNEVVKPDDTVWHLGDFAAWYNGVDARSYFNRLNGRKNLIWGNHDDADVRAAIGWEVSMPHWELSIGKQLLTLCHYGMRVWNQSHRGSIMLYGHSHNMLPPITNSLDVGVDCWDYRPVTLDQILKRLQSVQG